MACALEGDEKTPTHAADALVAAAAAFLW